MQNLPAVARGVKTHLLGGTQAARGRPRPLPWPRCTPSLCRLCIQGLLAAPPSPEATGTGEGGACEHGWAPVRQAEDGACPQGSSRLGGCSGAAWSVAFRS